MIQEHLTLRQQVMEVADRYLQSQRMKIVQRNLCLPVGDVDLVVKSKSLLPFVR